MTKFIEVLLAEYRDNVLPKLSDEDLITELKLLKEEWKFVSFTDKLQKAILQALDDELKKRAGE